ncbi:MAG: TolC family outer membrane protein [Hyphomicrobiaceae bacterium]|nr:TolC family outer membrane protein [Hyphomicrobiaceae bacterium]
MLFGKYVRVAALAASLSLAAVSAHAESLRDALANAYASNPNIASALLSVKASAEDIAIRRSGKLPQISGSASANYNWAVTGGTTTQSTTLQVGLSYRQVLFDSLKTDAQIEQARALAVAAAQALRNAEQNVLLSAASAYANVVRDTQLVRLRQDNVAFFQAQLQSAKDRESIGEGTRVDVSQAEAGLAQAIAAYQNAIASLQTSQASYVRWIGHDPRDLSLDFNFGNMLPSSLDQALNQAEGNHPAILAAQAQIRAAQSGSDAAKAAFGPTLSLISSICGFNCFGAGTSGMSGSVALQLSVPIYSGGALGASLRQANIRQIKSEIDALDARDQVRESVFQAWSGLQNAAAQIQSALSSERASQLALDGVIEERNVGQATTLDVLNARSNLTSAREVLISARTSQLIASFSLLAASGHLSAEYLSLPVRLQSADGYVQSVEDVWAELRSLPDN